MKTRAIYYLLLVLFYYSCTNHLNQGSDDFKIDNSISSRKYYRDYDFFSMKGVKQLSVIKFPSIEERYEGTKLKSIVFNTDSETRYAFDVKYINDKAYLFKIVDEGYLKYSFYTFFNNDKIIKYETLSVNDSASYIKSIRIINKDSIVSFYMPDRKYFQEPDLNYESIVNTDQSQNIDKVMEHNSWGAEGNNCASNDRLLSSSWRLIYDL